MRPLTHDDPHAIPRNGTDVPWLDLPDPDAERRTTRARAERDTGAGGKRRSR